MHKGIDKKCFILPTALNLTSHIWLTDKKARTRNLSDLGNRNESVDSSLSPTGSQAGFSLATPGRHRL